MYILLTRNILKNYNVINKTIKRHGFIINDLPTLASVPYGSKVLVFFESSITLSYLLDLKAALDLNLIVAVNNQIDFDMLESILTVRLVNWGYIDGELVAALQSNDTQQLNLISSTRTARKPLTVPESVYAEAGRILTTKNNSEAVKELAKTFINMVDAREYQDKQYGELLEESIELRKKNAQLEETLASMSKDMDDFIRTYKIVQAQNSARAVVDVIKDTSTVVLPTSITSLVIKNFGIPHLQRFVLALKDCLTVSFDKYVKVLYIAESDGVALSELNKSKFLTVGSDTKEADLMRSDMLLCIGSTKEPIDFITSASTVEVLIIVDSRRNPNMLIKGQTLTMYTAMDLETANNMNLDPAFTITASERSTYTLREADFVGKKAHALRNNDLVLRVANTLMGST